MWPFERHPCVRQHGETDCGAAALATVALSHGKRIALEILDERCGADRSGATVRGLVTAAEWLGFSPRVVRTSGAGLEEVRLPAIAQMKDERHRTHFVAVHGVSSGRVVLADPARGVRRPPRGEFARSWTGILLELVPGPGFSIDEEAAPPRSWRRLIAVARPHGRALLLAGLLGLVVAGVATSGSFFLRHWVDTLLPRGSGSALALFGVGISLLLAAGAALGLLRETLVSRVGSHVERSLASSYVERLMRLPISWFDGRQASDIVLRVRDASKVRVAVGGAALAMVTESVLAMTIFVVLLFCDVRLGILAATSVLALSILLLLHLAPSKEASRLLLEQVISRDRSLMEGVAGVEAVKACRMEGCRIREAADTHAAYLETVLRNDRLLNSAGASIRALGSVAGVAALCLGGHAVLTGYLSAGDALLLYGLIPFLLGPVERLAGLWVPLQEAMAAMERLDGLSNLRIEVGGGRDLASIESGLSLQGVWFRYAHRSWVLQGLQLDIPKGQRLAIVGESGSGKTTLAKLLLRFYDPDEGSIRIDGTDLRSFSLESLRRRVAIVPQDPFLFDRTIRDNIADGRPEATLDEVVAASKAARLHEFVSGLPMGYDTPCGERGRRLSSGQRQRLAIARAVLVRPEVLVFDEATSHLDCATEEAVYEAMDGALAGTTLVLIAHRLRTIRRADRIVVLGSGAVEEAGTHEELFARGGKYFDLWGSEARAANAGRQALPCGS